ncbi:MAG: metallophosphoesterase [Cyanobacteria bacterium SZAS LIN-3]|nr:metallophosphoesterase [Cyanobacteria bacterium SZAS LIN-3]
MTKFALIADAHIGPEKMYEGAIRKLSRHSLSYLNELTDAMSSQIQPQFVVQLGDLIEDAEEKNEDAGNYLSGLTTFERLPMPVLTVVGNHDQVNLNVDELCRYGKTESLYFSRDMGDFHCVVLFSSSVAHTDIHIDKAQQDWLAADLAATQKPTLVFLHHPLDEQDLTGNIWFEKYPHYCFVEERADVRQILNHSGKVCAVFNGHVHRNNLATIDGIAYVTIQSLVEKVGEPDVCSRAYGLVEIANGRLTVEVKGRDAALYDIALPRLASFSWPQ